MKTLVIQLDRTEDTGSIRDKVTWGKASRVLLVWPINYAVFDRKVDLVTIKRICTSQGSRLGIVCDDPVICAEADDLSIPIFESVNRAMRKGWDRRRRKKGVASLLETNPAKATIEEIRKWKNGHKSEEKIKPWLRLILLIAGILSVLVLALFLIPSATVTVYPMAQTQEMDVEFRVRSDSGGTANPGILNGELLSVNVEGEISRQTTGTTSVPGNKARGKISVINRSDEDVELPNGTLVLNNASAPVRYQILQAINIPAGGSVAGIEIEAVYAGTTGNSSENSVTRIDGESGLRLELNNPEPVTGGTDKSLPSPSSEDIRLLRMEAEKKLKINAESQFTTLLEEEDILIKASIRETDNLSEMINPEAGEVGASVMLSMKKEFSAVIVHKAALDSQARALLVANKMIPGWTITDRVPLSVEIIGQDYDTITQTAKLQTHIKGQIIPIVDAEKLRGRITGVTRDTAAAIIANQVLCDRSPIIESWPIWLPYLPWIESRISMEIP